MLPRYLNTSFQNKQTLGLVENSTFILIKKTICSVRYTFGMCSPLQNFYFPMKNKISSYSSSSPPPYPQPNISNASFVTPIAEDLNSGCFSHLQVWLPNCVICLKMQHYLSLFI